MTHKQRFIQQRPDDARQHATLVQSSAFLNSLDVALLEYQGRMIASPDMATAAANGFRLEGARGLIEVFKNLSTVQSISDKKLTGNLHPT